ncbi:hypothetical protein JCM30237_15710 [Halolamina litorea]|uniref:Uncharacterized protein n=1 Tax=Halolamina litorea TaxID=1515593 RepID=A0ABD6BP61_9EURY|nr:hypothetical protein [Halolamina litorea]
MTTEPPSVHVFGVAHNDETLVRRIPERAPDGVTKVYHEALNREERSLRQALLWRPLGWLAPSLRSDTPVSPPGSWCERAAISLAEANNAELHYVELSRKQRAAGLFYLPTVFEWLHVVFGLLAVVYVILSVGGWVAAFVTFVVVASATPHGDLWNHVEYPIRERHMADQIRAHLPDDGGAGVAIVGETHRPFVVEALAPIAVTSEDLTS